MGKIADEKIPHNVKKYVTCKICKEKILLSRKVETLAPVEGIKERKKREVATIKAPATPKQTKTLSASRKTSDRPKGRTFRPQFSGTAGEYFRIWIVNTFLTIVTLGIYAAWAKVRTRRYFYAHTKLAGHPFDYLANPVAILKGNLIMGGGLALYSTSDFFYPSMKIFIGIALAIIFPFLIYKSLRFYAHNSSFRNIRFHFRGGLKESYFNYLLIPLLIPLTFGLITPYWAYKRKGYFFNNFAYGKTGSNFAGRIAPFYRIHAVAAVLIILTLVAALSLFFGLGAGSIAALVAKLGSINSAGPGGKIGQAMLIGAIFSYLTIMLLFTIVQQYVFVRLTNYCWHHSRLGKVMFKSDIQVRKLVWIQMTNILAIICSLGLMAPWAKIRRARYILDNLAVEAYCNLDEFTADVAEDESALGDAATDFFDFEIGL
ncbi:MAG: DUF898 domain-containing protein [Proteobacteria bacterium]|nr:DUF898 domain-containing protein [Pseudomonadota bacterium]